MHSTQLEMGVEPKIGGFTPKWMVYNNGKPYEQMDDLGVPLFLGLSVPFYLLQIALGSFRIQEFFRNWIFEM